MRTDKGNLSGIDVIGNNDALHELRMQVNSLVASGGLIARDTVAFLAANSCPTGWTEFTEMRGRYVVGLLQNGTLKKTVGTPLGNGESRNNPGTHNHEFHDNMFAHQNGWNGSPNGSHDGEGLNASWRGDGPARRGSMKKATSQVGTNDTDSPYIQLLACIKL
ncbi:hypothetical protein RS130_07300 [Paraglaciecola aquimarina]|uniref:Uncharacterized protein n=1 Tax=Paraglaciecola aquimarina TaxID=1235557 RepID=A0ABU3SUT5_9ALTE|nr:hypothetical protein [Paraglaciecola aquimarina]MDU0353753.1 hypothetical protein [Paraglaciecola aquimarina]